MSHARLPQSPSEVLAFVRDRDVRMIDLRFIDLLGRWQHFTVPAHQLDEAAFERGFAFDGSSLRGWKGVHESDMVVVPDASSGRLDPFLEVPTFVLLGDVRNPDGTAYGRDPRQVARRAEAHLRRSGVATHAFFGPEPEFFVFDEVRVRSHDSHAASYQLDAASAHWNSDREEFPNLGYKVPAKGGYLPVPPTDAFHDLRTEMVLALEDLGITVERHHHEVASGGQAEIDIRYGTLLEQADKVCWLKYVVKNVARRAGKTATFIPKPLLGDNGSGMHTHMSLWRDAEPLFAGEHEGISTLARQFIAGILAHAPALCAFANPTTNSYKRLVPGYEAPIRCIYGRSNRSAAIRIPAAAHDPKACRIEFRTPDPMANPYLAFSAMLLAGLDGIERGLDPGPAFERDIFALSHEDLRQMPAVPASLEAALDALDADRGFLVQAGVFDDDLIDAWLGWKRDHEVHEVRMRPHPHEFALYYDG